MTITILSLTLVLVIVAVFSSIFRNPGGEQPGGSEPPVATTASPSPENSGGSWVVSPSPSPEASATLGPVVVTMSPAPSSSPDAVPDSGAKPKTGEEFKIYFEENEYTLTGADEFVGSLKEYLGISGDKVPDLTGWILYAEGTASDPENLSVALQRAQEVGSYLTGQLNIPKENVLPYASEKDGNAERRVLLYFRPSGSK